MDFIDTAEPNYFHIEWESTLKCNLDCSYCGDGHNNSIPHPSLEDSLKTLDFIVDYVGLKFYRRPLHMQRASLNILGGESLFHPNILEILEYAEQKKKEVDWQFYVGTITNAVVGKRLWEKVVSKLDYVTVSFHAEALPKQHAQVKTNLLYLKKQNKNFHVSIMMHPKHWDACINMVEFCEKHDIKHEKRQIDHDWFDWRFNYTAEQAEYITGKRPAGIVKTAAAVLTGGVNLSSEGRACCGGQTLCTNTGCTKFVDNRFKGWYCSVDRYFLYIRQTTGEIFTNKDCRMNFDGEVGPIGNLKDTESLLKRVEQGTYAIVCKKSRCWCGICAPKAKSKEDFAKIMRKYID